MKAPIPEEMGKIDFFVLIEPFQGCSCQDGFRGQALRCSWQCLPVVAQLGQGLSWGNTLLPAWPGIAAHPGSPARSRDGTAASVLPPGALLIPGMM